MQGQDRNVALEKKWGGRKQEGKGKTVRWNRKKWKKKGEKGKKGKRKKWWKGKPFFWPPQTPFFITPFLGGGMITSRRGGFEGQVDTKNIEWKIMSPRPQGMGILSFPSSPWIARGGPILARRLGWRNSPSPLKGSVHYTRVLHKIVW